ncbi:DUF2690 domain-containing protein [Kitasatospora aureofaciens]|uniref:DUF2690 domain-containing protein n=1 Tax=Kitasatospora aureofaciens TaxID=1894 RepID=UPI0027E21369|nr:DUF2690 domain-containing protein [Kitasatospora aureofaciens]
MTAVSLLLGLGLTGNAQAAAYDGQDPISAGCAGDAITAQETQIWDGYTNKYDGKIQLRYSPSCRTVWGRVIAYGGVGQGMAQVYRNSDNAYQQCMISGGNWNDSLGGYSCYTPMLNDAGVTGYATGWVHDMWGHVSSDSTGSY